MFHCPGAPFGSNVCKLLTTAPVEPSCSVGIGLPSGGAAHAAGPTIPSTVNPAPCWNCLTAVSSFGPKTPSTVSPRSGVRCGLPLSPTRSRSTGQSFHRQSSPSGCNGRQADERFNGLDRYSRQEEAAVLRGLGCIPRASLLDATAQNRAATRRSVSPSVSATAHSRPSPATVGDKRVRGQRPKETSRGIHAALPSSEVEWRVCAAIHAISEPYLYFTTRPSFRTEDHHQNSDPYSSSRSRRHAPWPPRRSKAGPPFRTPRSFSLMLANQSSWAADGLRNFILKINTKCLSFVRLKSTWLTLTGSEPRNDLARAKSHSADRSFFRERDQGHAERRATTGGIHQRFDGGSILSIGNTDRIDDFDENAYPPARIWLTCSKSTSSAATIFDCKPSTWQSVPPPTAHRDIAAPPRCNRAVRAG